MKQWLKKHFIPHEGNGHRPHFLHRHNTQKVIGLVLFVELILFVFPVFNFSRYFDGLNLGSVLPAVLSNLTNDERTKNNLPTLKESAVLTRAAQLKAEDMAAKSYFAHTSPEGLTPWYWLDQAGYSYLFAGENLAVNFSDSHEITEAWMNSPTHRANIVGGVYTEVGTGIATGVYKGHETVFVAQLYGRPAPVVATAAPQPITTPTTPVVAAVPQAEEVLGEATPEAAAPAKVPNLWEKAASSPNRTTASILYAVLSLVIVALVLNISIKAEHQHKDLIMNGAVAIAIILAIQLSNTYLARANFETTFTSFSSEVTSR